MIEMNDVDPNIANGIYTEFNVNHCVWVKLTDAGRAVHRNHWHRIYDGYPDWAMREMGSYQPPTEIDGWSRWRLWELMQTFGGKLHNVCNVPFETTIRMEN